MATAEEILAGTASSDSAAPENHLVISEDFRTVEIPTGQEVLGVYNDKDVRRVWFDMPAECDGTDLSDFDVYVHYVNAIGEGDAYTVDDLAVDGDHLVFSWLVGRNAFAAAGDVECAVCARKDNPSTFEVVKEFNTTTFAMPVLEGIQTSAGSEPAETDAFAQWKAQKEAEIAAAVADALAECQAAASAAWSAAYGQSIWTIDSDGRLAIIVGGEES